MELTSKYLESAITYLLENRIKYNNLANDKANPEKFVFVNYDFTNAYGNMITNFIENLFNKIQKVSLENKLHNYGNIWNIKNAIIMNNHNYPLSNFLLALLPEVDDYPEIIRNIIIEYCDVFNKQDYKVNPEYEFEIISLYISKLLVKVIYTISNDYKKYLTNIEELNLLTKPYGFEYYKRSKYHCYLSDILEKILKSNHKNIEPFIEYLELFSNKLDFSENTNAKESDIESEESLR
jgi:hypothetical protein